MLPCRMEDRPQEWDRWLSLTLAQYIVDRARRRKRVMSRAELADYIDASLHLRFTGRM